MYVSICVCVYVCMYMCTCVCIYVCMYVCIYVCMYICGDRGSKVVKALCYKSEGRWFDPSWCQEDFSLIQNPSDRTMALGVHSASNRNEYQEYFLGVKAAGA